MMDGEESIAYEPVISSSEPPPPARPWGRIGIVAAVVLIILSAVFWRLGSAQKPAVTRGVTLTEAVIHLPGATFQTIELILPSEGTLSLDVAVKTEGKEVIGVFMVAPDQLIKMKARQTFSHLRGFDSNRTRRYLRSARLAPGKYGLVLMNQSSGSAPPKLPVQVSARLVGLK